MAASVVYLPSFYFSLQILGDSSDAAFQEASGLSKEMGVEEVVSGGGNFFKYRLPTGTSYPNLVLKRGITGDASPLLEWCQATLEGGVSVPIQTRNLVLQLLNEAGQASITWNFVGAYPVKLATSDLKSQESNIVIETMEFAYQYFSTADVRIQ